MIVVSNTSPLTNLAAIGQFNLLEMLYQEIVIPTAVWNELNAFGIQWPGSLQVSQAPWVQRRIVTNRSLVTTLELDLDQGEAEAVALAVESGADLLLMDEKEGRRVAQRLGVKVTGVVGLLIEAKAQGRLRHIKPLLDSLRHDAGFFMTERFFAFALDLANESQR